MDNRRLFLAALLSFVLVLLWGRFVQPPPVAPPPPAEAELASEPDSPRRPIGGVDGGTAMSAADPASDPSTDSTDASAAQPAAPALPEVAASHAETVVVENERYRAELSNRGAQLVSFEVLGQSTADGEVVNLVRARGEDPYPFGLRSGEQAHPLNDALFQVERNALDSGVEEIRFLYRGGLGTAEKAFRFQPTGLIDVEIAVADDDRWSVVFGPGVRNPSVDEMEDRLIQRMASYKRGDDEEKILPTKQKDVVIVPAAGLQWATLEDNYFLAALVPSSGVSSFEIRPLRQAAEIRADESRYSPSTGAGDEATTPAQEMLLRPSDDRVQLTAYMGAKNYGDLADLPYGLESTVRWGFFGFVARPMYYGLVWIYERIPNYGWAIVLMTLIIKLIFFPLTHKSQKSMAKMQEISPKVQALRNRYRSKLKDKQGRPNAEAQRQMNEEMMTLYRQAGVNPASGCLPVLLQIPVFFAFFRLLSTAIELRGAPWLGWVHDLSIADPWYLLPAVMLITSVMLQRMTPPPPDPVQRRLMQLFPFMFGIFAIAFPAGLVLYWTTNNILTMGQQAFYLRSKKKNEAAA